MRSEGSYVKPGDIDSHQEWLFFLDKEFAKWLYIDETNFDRKEWLIELLTDAGVDANMLYGMTYDSLVRLACSGILSRRLRKYYTHSYKEGDVLVQVYRPTDPRLRRVVSEPRTGSIFKEYTLRERDQWIEDYQSSLSTVPRGRSG